MTRLPGIGATTTDRTNGALLFLVIIVLVVIGREARVDVLRTKNFVLGLPLLHAGKVPVFDGLVLVKGTGNEVGAVRELRGA